VTTGTTASSNTACDAKSMSQFSTIAIDDNRSSRLHLIRFARRNRYLFGSELFIVRSAIRVFATILLLYLLIWTIS
jgi:hypothetical protein